MTSNHTANNTPTNTTSSSAGHTSSNGSNSIVHKRSIRGALSPLHWLATLLTLDSPGTVKRYAIPPLAIKDPDTVRRILGRRTEFSIEAINKAKIVMGRCDV